MGGAFKANAKQVLLVLLLYVFYGAIQYFLAAVDQHNMVADFFYLLHAVRAEDDSGARLARLKISSLITLHLPGPGR
jgi:hypothetical protein